MIQEVRKINLYETVIKLTQTEQIKSSILNFKKCLKQIQKEKNILIVGSGGSYVTGLYSKFIIEKNMKNLCEVLKPMEVMQTNLEMYSYVIIYSYKMKNYDIKKTIEYIIENNYIEKILIVTAKEPKIKYNHNKIVYIYYDEKSDYERKYVSYKGIYLPTFILGSCFEQLKINLNKLESCKLTVNNGKEIDVFYDKENNCLAQLIERHLCELGIATVRIHEKKDFSHGRMSILEKNNEVIFIESNNYDVEYSNILLEYLKNVYNCNILNENEILENAKLNYYEKMLMILQWINECAIHQGIFIEEKKDTKADEKLFKYGEEKL